jgi:hypothetical protein
VKLRDLLKRFRFRSVQLEDDRRIDNVDAMASGAEAGMAPPGWVPSQQDERPHH